MVKQNPYKYGHKQVARGGSFIRVENARFVRTRGGSWLPVSSQRDIYGTFVDPRAICSAKVVNEFCHAIMTGNDAKLYSINGDLLLEYEQNHLLAGLGGGREVIPLQFAKRTISIKVRTDLIGNEADEYGAYRLLYRNGSEHTPAVKIYWARPRQ